MRSLKESHLSNQVGFLFYLSFFQWYRTIAISGIAPIIVYMPIDWSDGAMISIASVDPNFSIPQNALPQGLEFYNIAENLSLVSGLMWESGCFRRMPPKIASGVSDGVYQLHFHTSGGRVRFCTNSRRVAVVAGLNHISKMSHFAFSGSIGFDLYERIDNRQIFIGTAIPSLDVCDSLEYLWEFAGNEIHELTLHLPLYTGVDNLYIGIDEGATFSAAPDYTYRKPIVYYGSSITQGGCASRPGNAYPNQISLMLDCDHVNLGFSGNAKAEGMMAEYISNLDMSVFVYDYDHNAPNEAHLAATHEKMFQRIRSAQPDIPIIIMSMPKCKPSDADKQQRRFQIIQQTYLNAIAAGDQNVYLISGTELLGDCAEFATVDNCHPNDLGFYMMAQKLASVINPLLYHTTKAFSNGSTNI